MANLSKSKALFGFTSPRTIENKNPYIRPMKKMNMRIALDIDDVIAAFTEGALRAVNDYMPTERFDHWDPDGPCGIAVNKLHESGTWNDPNFWANLPLLAIPGDVQKLNPTCYVTSSPQEFLDVRREWLKSHGFPKLPMFHSKNKGALCAQLSMDFLIDDSPKNLRSAFSHKVNPIQFVPWYSSTPLVGDFGFGSLIAVMAYIDTFKNDHLEIKDDWIHEGSKVR